MYVTLQSFNIYTGSMLLVVILALAALIKWDRRDTKNSSKQNATDE